MKAYEEVLEFNLIKEQLMNEACTAYGKNLINKLSLMSDKLTLVEELAKTDEAMRIILRIGACPLVGIHNVEDYLLRLSKHGLLTIEEIYRIYTNLEFANSIKRFEGQLTFKDCPFFSDYATSLVYFPLITKKINQCITADLSVADSATPRLGKIRREIKNLDSEIKSKLDSFLSKKSEFLSDSLVTTRNDRLVVPVKSTYKYSFGGIIHDESQTGQTVFIEPDFVIELNAKLMRLRLDEHEEIIIVLKMLCELLRSELEHLERNEKLFGLIDLMFAKGKFGVRLKAKIGEVADEQIIELHHARHPLIDPKKVIANDILLGSINKSILLVSGPNTGGKTVFLKSAGLLTLMHQCGLAIPVDGVARLGIFNKFFVDIGDEQSIEQSLSSFSSHMQKLIHFLDTIDGNSLILLDELGGGTDPKEGEALAMAIIEEIHRRKAICVVTTHYSNLKTFALDSGYVGNASMLFDQTTISPLYKIVMDIPGRSYALEISSRLGMRSSLIKRAQYFKDYYSAQSERLIEKLEGELLQSNAKLEELLLLEDSLKAREIELNQKLEKAEEINKKIQADATQQIEEIILLAELQIDEIVNNLKNRPIEEIKMHEWVEAKRKLKGLKKEEELTQVETITINPGDYVRVKNINKHGQVIRLQGDKAHLNVGGLSLVISLNELEKIPPVVEKETVSISRKSGQKMAKYELNIIGLRVEEAMILVEKHLDDALLTHLKVVRIVHGFGTGALRKAVHQYLDRCSYVSEYRLGGQGEGSGGATIITLK